MNCIAVESYVLLHILSRLSISISIYVKKASFDLNIEYLLVFGHEFNYLKLLGKSKYS